MRKRADWAGSVLVGVVALLAVGVFALRHRDHPAATIDFEIEVTEADGRPAPCRVHLRGPEGKVWNSPDWPSFDDHFVYPGKASFRLPSGAYGYEIERGPEYRPLRGSFEVAATTRKNLKLRLDRVANLASEGWYSGDLHIHRKPKDVPLLMQAEDLYVGPIVTWWNSEEPPTALDARPVRFDGGRFMDATAGEDERQGGALLYFGLAKPFNLPPSMRNEKGQITHKEGDEHDEYPSPAELAQRARQQPGVHIDIEKPFWWDTPTWIGLGLADSIGIAHNQMTRASVHNGEAWGKWRTPQLYEQGPSGHALWTEDIYYHVLDAGIRLAPSAGSASGALPNPVGYDRVYVHLDGGLDYDGWWRGLKAGQSFVTNGPLLLVSANGQLPGHVFTEARDGKVSISLATRLVSNEPIDRVELVRDGQVAQIGSYARDQGTVSFSPLSFEQSGWFLVRAIAARSDNFRFASSAPFYVERKPAMRRISRASVQFFIDWIEERMGRLRGGTMPPEKLESVLAFHREAERFWQNQLAQANAD